MDDKIQFKKKDFNNYSLSEDRNIEIESLSKRINQYNYRNNLSKTKRII